MAEIGLVLLGIAGFILFYVLIQRVNRYNQFIQRINQ